MQYIEPLAKLIEHFRALPGVGASENGCLRLWPHKVRGDGQFAALLRRMGEAPHRNVPRSAPLPKGHSPLKATTWIRIPLEVLNRQIEFAGFFINQNT